MWTIKSKQSVGQLRLGVNVNELTQILGSEYTKFKRVAEAGVILFEVDGIELYSRG